MKIAALPLSLGMPFLAAFFAPASAQQGVPTTIVGVKGACENISLAGTPARCASGAGVIYSVLPNGRVLITFPLADGRVASFVGEKDSQPRPEQYYLYLSRIRIVSNGTEFAAKLAGQCVVDMSRDGKIWLLVNCTATDENSEAYSFQFRGDGTPVDVKHPGAPPPSPGHVDQRTITDITRRFKAAMAAGGIRAVAQDLEKCFDEGLGKSSVIRACMLYDISAVNFDKTMRKMFESRGVDVGSQVPFLTDRAFAARMQIYSGMAFAGTEAAAYQFFGTAPTTVINGLSK